MNDTLAERGSRYGDFATHAQITQDLKAVFVASPRWTALSAAQKESLEMVAHKIGRILNGDPNYADSWHDIVGYAKLVEDLLNGSTPAILSATHGVSLFGIKAAEATLDANGNGQPTRAEFIAAIEEVNPELAQSMKVDDALKTIPPQYKARPPFVEPVTAPVKTAAPPPVNILPSAVVLPDDKEGK